MLDLEDRRDIYGGEEDLTADLTSAAASPVAIGALLIVILVGLLLLMATFVTGGDSKPNPTDPVRSERDATSEGNELTPMDEDSGVINATDLSDEGAGTGVTSSGGGTSGAGATSSGGATSNRLSGSDGSPGAAGGAGGRAGTAGSPGSPGSPSGSGDPAGAHHQRKWRHEPAQRRLAELPDRRPDEHRRPDRHWRCQRHRREQQRQRRVHLPAAAPTRTRPSTAMSRTATATASTTGSPASC